MVFRAVVLVAIAAPLFAQPGSIVEGRIASSTTHAGIGEVRVTLRMVSEPKTDYNATTDASGAFRIVDLPRGEYVPDFLRIANYVDVPAGHRARNVLSVVPGRDPIRLDVELEPMARLSGRVLDSTRRPVEDAQVELTLHDGEMVIVDRAGRDGVFTIPSLVPGKWRIQAVPNFAAVGAEPQAWESDAEEIHVRPGQQLSGYDIRTRAVPILKVRGEVLDPSGRPVHGITVEVRASRGPMLPLEATKVTDADGLFEVALRPGVWLLIANTAGPLKWYGATTITLARSDVADVRIRINTRFNLPVNVDCAAPERTNLYLVPASLPLDQMRSLRHERGGPSAINDLAPGRYRISIRSVPSGTYLESMFLGEQDVLGREVDLYDGSPPLRLACKANPLIARGTVESGQNAQVVFLPQEESLRGEYSIRTAVSDAAGRYGVSGLRPGNYYVFAFDQLRSMVLLYDPLFIQALVSRAVRVELRKGESLLVV